MSVESDLESGERPIDAAGVPARPAPTSAEPTPTEPTPTGSGRALELGFLERDVGPTRPRVEHVEVPTGARAGVSARVEGAETLPAAEGLDALAAAVFEGSAGRTRLAPLLARYAREVGELALDDPDFDLLSVTRMDWALCEAQATDPRWRGDTWAWRAVRGEIPGVVLGPESTSSDAGAGARRAAATSIVGLFEVYPGDPTWVRDRLSGVVARVFDSVGPWPGADPLEPAALWELRLIPDQAGGFHMARAPLDYPTTLLTRLEAGFHRRFETPPWPALQDLRRARLRHLRAGMRTSIERMLDWT